jgi:hypothetical protein
LEKYEMEGDVHTMIRGRGRREETTTKESTVHTQQRLGWLSM